MSRPWTRHYDPAVPPSLSPYPRKTLVDYVRENARKAPAAPAVLFKGSALSNARLDSLSDRFAAGLLSEGLKPGDRVALLLPNCPQFLIAEIGAWKAGLTVLPLNPLYTPEELLGPLRAAEPKLMVTLTPFYQRVKQIQSSTSIRRVAATSIKEYFPPHLKLLFTLLMEKKGGHRIDLEPDDVWLTGLFREGRLPSGPAPESPAIMLLSGGTTGSPKAVVGPHSALVAAGLQISTWLQPPAGSKPDVALIPLPLFHVYACVGAQSHAIVGCNPLALVPNPRDLDDVLKTIAQVKPTLFSGVPALFIALLNHPKVKTRAVDFSSIRASFSGAAPLMAATKAQFEELTGGRIVEGYSLTEAMMACVVNPLAGRNKVGSVGLPLPDVEVAIVDAEDGTRVLGTNETGEIILRAPQLMSGYWDQPGETSNMLRMHDDEGGPWLHTGDLGYQDEDCYLFIVDRKKDLIKTSGCQVWPREVEEVIASHPAVQEVGVAGVPDPLRGEVVKAWIVVRGGATLSRDEVRAFCKTKLAPFKVPAQVEFRESLPKTMAGKVLRRALQAEFAPTRDGST